MSIKALLNKTSLDTAIGAAKDALLAKQDESGFWCFELESDATITAEYILMMHFVDEIDISLQAAMARYLRELQRLDRHGGWDLYHDGAINISASVKAYFALKAAGDSPDAPHMRRAREAILALGGAATSNVFTRILLATFGQVSWRAVPYMPVELILLPRWFPITLDKMAYWARSTLVPLMVLCSIRARAVNRLKTDIRELFVEDPMSERGHYVAEGFLKKAFVALDKVVRHIEPLIPRRVRARALRKASDWCIERANGVDGLGGIFPPMVYWYEMMVVQGVSKTDQNLATCRESIQKLIVHRDDGVSYCQPCLSPVWDTAWSLMALQGASGDTTTQDAVQRGYDWMAALQERDVKGDWIDQVDSNTRPGGWAFQFKNAHYPDLDDTAVVAAMLAVRGRHLGEPERYQLEVDRAVEWLLALQSTNGGFGAFDKNCDRYYLNAIPFADHGALLDPPTEDVSGRVLLCLGLTGNHHRRSEIEACLRYVRQTQQPDGSWWGRWGTNYIYGTWSVLAGLAMVGEDPSQPYIRKAVDWLRARQNPDGGWGETNDSYLVPALAGTDDGKSSPHSTAWALLALFAVGEARCAEAAKGIDYLLRTQNASGLWDNQSHNAPGFPRIYYLKYHGYAAYFPLWALTRYRQLTGQRTTVRAIEAERREVEFAD